MTIDHQPSYPQERKDHERTENRRSGRPGDRRQPRHRASPDGGAPDPGREEAVPTARDPERLSALRDERLVSLRLDVTDVDQIRAAAEAAPDVELVFNNAGVVLATGITDDDLEAGQEDILPDPYAVDFGRQFGSSPKDSERQIAAMTAAMLSGPAA